MICSSVVNSVDLRKSENGFRFGAKTAAEKSVAMTIMVIFATCGLKNSWIVMARKVATNTRSRNSRLIKGPSIEKEDVHRAATPPAILKF